MYRLQAVAMVSRSCTSQQGSQPLCRITWLSNSLSDHWSFLLLLAVWPMGSASCSWAMNLPRCFENHTGISWKKVSWKKISWEKTHCWGVLTKCSEPQTLLSVVVHMCISLTVSSFNITLVKVCLSDCFVWKTFSKLSSWLYKKSLQRCAVASPNADCSM